MSAPISLSSAASIRDPVLAQPGAAAQPGDFAGTLADAIASVERFRLQADGKVDAVLSGEPGDLHEAVLATQKAELAFELFLQVRNKVVQAYQEVMRMQM